MTEEKVRKEDHAAWEELFSILGNAPAELTLTQYPIDKVHRTETGKLQIMLQENTEREVALHETGHVLYSPFNWMETLGLRSVHPSVQMLANSVEDARIDRRTSEHFGRDVTQVQRLALEQSIAARKLAPSPMRALISRAYGIPVEYSAEEEALLKVFGRDIDEAVASDETLVSVRLALRIGYYLHLQEKRAEEEKRKRAHAERESTETPEKRGSDAETKSEEDGEKPESRSDGEPESESDAETGSEEDGEKPEKDEDREDESELERKATRAADKALTKALEKLAPHLSRAREEKRKEKEREHREHEEEKRSASSTSDHAYTIWTPRTEPLVASETVRLLLGGLEGESARAFRTRGIPTSRVWRLGFGDRRIYARRAKLKTRALVALVDLSGSMLCWCDACGSGKPGWLAFQCVAALQEAVTNIRTFGFCSSESKNYIVPIERGTRLVCRSKRSDYVPGGNSDCVALGFLETLLVNTLDNAAAVIISDGLPHGPSPMIDEHLVSHTRELAKSMVERGLRFASVLIKTLSTIYPSSIVAHVDSVKDIGNLGSILAWLREEEE